VAFSNSGIDMTIAWIAAAEYDLDSQGWRRFPAADGAYGGYLEAIDLSLAGLPRGDHSIDIRAISSVDNGSLPLHFDFHSALAVPEPATWSLAIAGAAGLLGVARRRGRARRTESDRRFPPRLWFAG
jgi:hypothetical protein